MIENLSNSFAVAGYEDDIIYQIKQALSSLNVNFTCDKLGNIIASIYKNPDFPTLFIGCGIDEPGLIVTDITDDGFLKFDIIGNIDIKTLVSKKVVSNNVSGIISLKAIHLLSEKERSEKLTADKLCIDIGALSREDALKQITVGDYFSFDVKYESLSDVKIKGKALSRAAQINILIDSIKNFDCDNINVIYAFVTQNEVTYRGLKTILTSLKKFDLAIFLDSIDTNGKILSGMGPVIVSSAGDITLTKKIIEKISLYDIQHQNHMLSKPTFQKLFKSTNLNIPILSLAVPCNHKNAIINTIDKRDIVLTESLLRKITEEAKELVKL